MNSSEGSGQQVKNNPLERRHYRIDDLNQKSKIRFRNYTKYFILGADVLALTITLLTAKLTLLLVGKADALATFTLKSAFHDALWLALFYIVITTAFYLKGHYTKRWPFWLEFKEIFYVVVSLAVLSAAVVFLSKLPLSRLGFILVWVCVLGLIPLFRYAMKSFLLKIGAWRLPTVILGAGLNAIQVADALSSEKLMGYDVLCLCDFSGKHSVRTVKFGNKIIPIVGMQEEPWGFVQRLNFPHLVLALDHDDAKKHTDIMREFFSDYKNIQVAPPVRGIPLFGTEVQSFFSHDVLLLTVRNNLSRLWARTLKRLLDIAGSSIGIILLLPLFLAVAFKIRREDRGPVFFTQERVGRNGKKFNMLKFRTMVIDAENMLAEWKDDNIELLEEYRINNYKLKNDPRVTKVGRWIRATSIDELPQLWNVLIGQMSLVGPRPLLERELDNYGSQIKWYMQARPAMTGIWQISGRSETTFQERANMDSWYIKNWSLWYDIYILLQTVVVVFSRKGAY